MNSQIDERFSFTRKQAAVDSRIRRAAVLKLLNGNYQASDPYVHNSAADAIDNTCVSNFARRRCLAASPVRETFDSPMCVGVRSKWIAAAKV